MTRRPRTRYRPPPDIRGVTLIELLVAIAVLAMLLSLAVPSFRDAALSSSLNAIANNMYASVQLARSEAIKRNQVVTLCASSDGSTCDGEWREGWIVMDAASNVLQRQEAVPRGFRVTEAAAEDSLSFQPIGVGATAATFTVCRASPAGEQERVVSITATGSPYVTRTEAGSCP